MNLVFWGEEYSCDTNVYMQAVAEMLRLLGEPVELRVGRFVQKGSGTLGICDCKSGLSGKKRHYLWHSDLTVVCLKQKKACVDSFFQKDFHVAKNMMFLLSGYECEEGVDAKYLERVYRVTPEQIAVIPYNSRFYYAFDRGRSDVFMKREFDMPSGEAEMQFMHSLECAAVHMMHQIGWGSNRQRAANNQETE